VESLQDVIAGSPVRLLPGQYAVAKCEAPPEGPGFFMVSRDADEVTVIAEEAHLPALGASAAERGYRLVEIRVAAPFLGVGLLAAVSSALAGAGISILIVSTFSKDYVLLKSDCAAKGLEALALAGFPVAASS
jgi:hypothetical protein